MKKFLSLLLAMTMVMSLIVLPARAEDDLLTGATLNQETLSVALGSTATLEVNLSGGLKIGEDSLSNTAKFTVTQGPSIEFATSASGTATVAATVNAGQRATITPVAAGAADITATVTAKYKLVSEGTNAQEKTATQVLTCKVTVYKPEFSASDIASISYKERVCALNGSTVSVPYFTASENSTLSTTASDWVVTLKRTSPFKLKSAVYDGTKLTVTETGDSHFDLTVTPNALTPTFTATPSSSTIGKNASVTLTASSYSGGISELPIYKWTYGSNNTEIGTGASLTWKPVVASGATYPVTIAVKCTAYEGSVKTAERSFNIQVTEDDYVVTLPAVGKLPTNAANIFTLVPGTAAGSNFQFYKNDAHKTHIASNVTYTYSSSAPSVATISSDGKISTLAAGYTNITITATYNGAAYTRTFAVQVVNPTYTLGSTYCGYNNSVYRANELVSYATSALTTAGITGVTVGSVALANASGNVVTAAGAEATGYTLTASPTYLGTADLTATVTKSGGGTFKMTFKVPVLPIPYSTSLGTVNAEPYTTGSTYYNNTYRVTLPTTFNQYYVVSKNTTPNYNVSAAPASGVTTVTLNQNDFVNGQCTLYVIAWNSNYNGYGYGYNYGTNYYGKYYSGAITVTQTNHDIKYNGVVGGTVQFKHNDFTTFMNEMYGTNTTSYLTFNSVKFTSVPNATSQGTLYYNGVAMTTGYGSNYFNTSTAVTNLDNVSFSVSSRVPSTTKEIRIPFTLYATRYNSYGTSAGTSVTYSGVVVISLVREDVTFTVAPGDSVRFTDSAFLTYLRSASGINYNYNIDYVTFDQSAVNALNEGVLYAYSTGFNAVKTTDRFYYTTTNYNQNALSDVTFRASTYAKTGTTVYIPFTIYAKYGTSSATRQVTGTVAIKIAQTMNFVDVKTSDYFYDSVKWAVNNNITKGTSATTFSPNNTCTRAEIVTFLWRAAGSPTPTITRNPFTDVKYPVGSDFYNAILWASQNGITAGKTTTTFAPNDNCTRAQIVTFLWRYAKKPLGYYTNPFNDVNKTEYAAYYDAILWAAGKGIATGNTPKTFDPDGTCTRAEAVTFLYRYESTK